MFLHDRYQTICRFCNKVLEADSADQALRDVAEHEKGKHPDRFQAGPMPGPPGLLTDGEKAE